MKLESKAWLRWNSFHSIIHSTFFKSFRSKFLESPSNLSYPHIVYQQIFKKIQRSQLLLLMSAAVPLVHVTIISHWMSIFTFICFIYLQKKILLAFHQNTFDLSSIAEEIQLKPQQSDCVTNLTLLEVKYGHVSVSLFATR